MPVAGGLNLRASRVVPHSTYAVDTGLPGRTDIPATAAVALICLQVPAPISALGQTSGTSGLWDRSENQNLQLRDTETFDTGTYRQILMVERSVDNPERVDGIRQERPSGDSGCIP